MAIHAETSWAAYMQTDMSLPCCYIITPRRIHVILSCTGYHNAAIIWVKFHKRGNEVMENFGLVVPSFRSMLNPQLEFNLRFFKAMCFSVYFIHELKTEKCEHLMMILVTHVSKWAAHTHLQTKWYTAILTYMYICTDIHMRFFRNGT